MCIVLERDSDESASEKDDDDDEVRALMEEDLSCSVCKYVSINFERVSMVSKLSVYVQQRNKCSAWKQTN